MKKLHFVLVFIIVFCSGQRPEKVKNLTAYKDTLFTEVFRRSEGWIAGDGAFSIPLGNGKSLWTFGDSYMDCYDKITGKVPCLFQARNAVMVIKTAEPYEASTLKNPDDPSFFRLGKDRKYWFWPVSGYSYGDTAYIFQSRLKSTGEPGMWGFAGVDSNYVSKLSLSGGKNECNLLPSHNGIGFGTSVIVRDRFVYIYGIKSNGFGNDLFVARFFTGEMYGPWEYYDGKGWTNDINRISSIHSEFTSSFNLCMIDDRYILITTEFSVDCDQGKNIFAASGSNPWGPFLNHHSIWQVDDLLEGHYPFFYCANAHPEYDNGREELLVTYCINSYGKCVETCINNRLDPDVYRPKAIRVPFSLL